LGALGRRLLGLARPEWRWLVLGFAFLLVASVAGLAYPQAIRVITDEALAGRGLETVDRAAVAMVAIFLVQGIAIAVRQYAFASAGERIVTRLRQSLYRNLVGQEIAFFDQNRTGDLLSRLGTDAATIQAAATVNLSAALRSTAATVGGMALLFYTSPALAALMLVVVPVVVVATLIVGRSIRRLSRSFHDALARATEIAEETLGGVRTVRAFAREATEAERYGEAVTTAFRAARARALSSAIYSGAVAFVGYAVVALVLWRGGRLVIGGSMSVGDLTSFVLYTLIVAFSLGDLGGLYADFMRAAGASERVFELLDRAAAMPLASGARPPLPVGRISLEAVDFSYPVRPGVTVLHGLDLELAPGEVVALVGPSGSGKSTLAGLIPRFYDPERGRVCFDGRDLRELDATWLRQQIGIVAQEPLLMSTSVGANICYGRLAATAAEVEAAARAANAHDFVAAFPGGYDTLVGERGVQLSAGQRQRVAIARALLKDPRVLILDEATSALDAENEHLVREALQRLQRGRTTLIIAHRLSTVVGADRVVVLESGTLVQQGSHRELMAAESGLYRRLVERQFIAA
jgi:ATP-binding cassette subfamily B protein